MCLLCQLPVAKNNTIVGKFLHFWALLYRPAFTDDGQIWCVEADTRSILTRQISSECVIIVSASGGQNPQFWANFDILGDSCTDSLLPMRAKFGVLYQTHGLRLLAKFRLDRFILSPSGGKNIFSIFCHNLDFGI